MTISTFIEHVISGFYALSGPGSSAKCDGAKRAAMRIIEHKKRWKDTPRNPGITRQMARNIMRKRMKKERQAKKALIILKRKRANGIIGDIS